jgi:hypothetical protein
MSPIKGLTDNKRLVRVGKIHLGYRTKSASGKEHPVATPYFVCPPEVQKVFGKEPKEMEVVIPVEDDEMWCSQYYRQYSSARGLVCKGDGELTIIPGRMIDTDTGELANRNTKPQRWERRVGIECPGKECPDYKSGACQEVMNLQVLMPRVAGAGIWQIDTGSVNSIRNINDMAALLRAVAGRVRFFPLTLSLEQTEVISPEDGKKKTVFCLHLRTKRTLIEIAEIGAKAHETLVIEPPDEADAPRDKLLTNGNPDNREEFEGVVEDDIDTLFPKEEPPRATPGECEPPPQFDMQWLKKALEIVNWKPIDVAKWAWKAYGIPFEGKSLTDIVCAMNTVQQQALRTVIEERANRGSG